MGFIKIESGIGRFSSGCIRNWLQRFGLIQRVIQRRLEVMSDILDLAKAEVTITWIPSDRNPADALTRLPSHWGKFVDLKSHSLSSSAADTGAAAAVVSTNEDVPDDSDHEDGDPRIKEIRLPPNETVSVPVVTEDEASCIATTLHNGHGHPGWRGLYEYVRRRCFCDGLAKLCQQVCQRCIVCAASDPRKVLGRGGDRFVAPVIPDRPFQMIQVDVAKISEGGINGGVITAICMLSRFAEAEHFEGSINSALTTGFLQKLVCRYGAPEVIRHDNGLEFEGFFSDFVASCGIKVLKGTPYHPQSQGMIERFHRTLFGIMRKSAVGDQWRRMLPAVVGEYNLRMNSSIGISPMKALYGWQPEDSQTILDDSKAAEVTDFVTQSMMKSMPLTGTPPSDIPVGRPVLVRRDLRSLSKTMLPFDIGWIVARKLGHTYELRSVFNGKIKVVNRDRLIEAPEASATELNEPVGLIDDNVFPSEFEADANKSLQDESESDLIIDLACDMSETEAGSAPLPGMKLRDRSILKRPIRFE